MDPEMDHVILDKPPKAFHKEKSPKKKDLFKEYLEKINVGEYCQTILNSV